MYRTKIRRPQFEGRHLFSLETTVWRAWAPPKQKQKSHSYFFTSSTATGIWPNNYFYMFCHRNLEFSAHLFMECPIINQLRNMINSWPNCNCITRGLHNAAAAGATSVDELLQHLLKTTPSRQRKGINSFFILTCWSIWRERNERVFRDKEVSIAQLGSFIRAKLRVGPLLV